MRVLYCSKCLWATEVPQGTAIANKCDNCGEHGLGLLVGTEEEIQEHLDKCSLSSIE